jgi:hypothetical protein
MEHQWPVAVVCRVLGAPRSTVYARRQPKLPARPGPATSIGDHDLLQLIRRVLRASPFAGEGYPQGPGPPSSRARRRCERETGPAAAAPGRPVGTPAGPGPPSAAAA